MHITGYELTAASSAVAALAIVGGYLGVSSANRNALKIAREERSAKRKDELDALKRTTYGKLLAAITALASANMEQESLEAAKTPATFKLDATRKRIAAAKTVHNCMAELALTSSNTILDNLANEAFKGAAKCTREDVIAFTRGAAKLRAALREDLRGAKIPNPEELDCMVDVALAKQAPGAVTAKDTAPIAGSL
jgi:hypothetical protein